MLPHVKIYFENGVLKSTSATDDAVVGLIASGVAVTGKFVLGTAYLLTSLDDLSDLGITSTVNDANALIYKTVSEFYAEAPTGNKLWLMGVADTVLMSEMVDVEQTYGKALVNTANGAISFIMLAKKDATGVTPTITSGLDADVALAAAKAQALGQWATDTKYAPLFTIIPGRHYNGTASDLADLTTGAYNRVAILIGDTVSGGSDATVGTLAGRIAAIPVQRSIARVKTGALIATSFYIGGKVAELGNPDVINDLGYITLRTFVGKAGYYFTDDKLATNPTDDYALIPRRRVIDKAYRIAYKTMATELSDEIPVNDEGQIPAPIVKSIQNSVETAIENNMPGNLGVDPSDSKDTGVQCYINVSQNIVSTSKLGATLRVKPFGYAKYIDVYLGFTTTA
jgi:Protein of unknown function (DUF2586).